MKDLLNIVFFTFFFGLQLTYGQLAKQRSLTSEQVKERINALLSSKDPLAADSIRWEADQLRMTKKEAYIQQAKNIYGALGDSEGMVKAHLRLIDLFPKSSYTANSQLESMLSEYMTYESFVKDFNKWSNTHKGLMADDKFAGSSYFQVVRKLIANDELDIANSYMQKVKTENVQVSYKNLLAHYYFDHGDTGKAIGIMVDIIGNHKGILAGDLHFLANGMYNFYTSLLVKQGEFEQALTFIADKKLNLFNEEFESLIGVNRYFDAFLLLDKQFTQFQLTPLLAKEGPNLFVKLGSTTANWEIYKNKVEERKLQENQQFWKTSMIDQEAIDFELMDMAGNVVKSKDLRGKIVVLDFWATWCGPCIRSFPGMQEAQKQFKDDNDVIFLFVNTSERSTDYKSKVKSFMAEKGYDFHVIFDNMDQREALAGKYGLDGIPAKLIIDKAGRLRFKSTGTALTAKEIVDEISYKISLVKNLDKASATESENMK